MRSKQPSPAVGCVLHRRAIAPGSGTRHPRADRRLPA